MCVILWKWFLNTIYLFSNLPAKIILPLNLLVIATFVQYKEKIWTGY